MLIFTPLQTGYYCAYAILLLQNSWGQRRCHSSLQESFVQSDSKPRYLQHPVCQIIVCPHAVSSSCSLPHENIVRCPWSASLVYFPMQIHIFPSEVLSYYTSQRSAHAACWLLGVISRVFEIFDNFMLRVQMKKLGSKGVSDALLGKSGCWKRIRKASAIFWARDLIFRAILFFWLKHICKHIYVSKVLSCIQSAMV